MPVRNGGNGRHFPGKHARSSHHRPKLFAPLPKRDSGELWRSRRPRILRTPASGCGSDLASELPWFRYTARYTELGTWTSRLALALRSSVCFQSHRVVGVRPFASRGFSPCADGRKEEIHEVPDSKGFNGLHHDHLSTPGHGFSHRLRFRSRYRARSATSTRPRSHGDVAGPSLRVVQDRRN